MFHRKRRLQPNYNRAGLIERIIRLIVYVLVSLSPILIISKDSLLAAKASHSKDHLK